MPYTIDCEVTLDGHASAIRDAWTEMAEHQTWHLREEESRIDGPLAAGRTGFSQQVGGPPRSPFQIVRVEPKARWTNE